MDPDAIFIILMLFVLSLLTVISIVGLCRKLWSSRFKKAIKISLIVFFIALFIGAILNLDEIGSGQTTIKVFGRESYVSFVEISVYIACFLIALNWSINLSRRQLFQKIKLPVYLKFFLLVILLTVLIPVFFYFVTNFLVELNIMGSVD